MRCPLLHSSPSRNKLQPALVLVTTALLVYYLFFTTPSASLAVKDATPKVKTSKWVDPALIPDVDNSDPLTTTYVKRVVAVGDIHGDLHHLTR